MGILDILYRLVIGPIELLLDVIFSLSLQMIGSPILSILVLSLSINILVLPLYNRADAIQKEEQETSARLKPGIDLIRAAFRGDERFMILQTYYRQNHYKPYYALRSSLSLLLQIPFFMAAYNFLAHLNAIQGVSFGPIPDLGAPDGILKIGGLSVNLLPVLMTLINIGSGIVYTKGMPLKSKIQLYAMARVFLVLLYRSPAGLVIYWTLNNLFSLCKNLIKKTREPGKIVCALCSVVGIILAVLVFSRYQGTGSKKALWGYILGAGLQLPALGLLIRKRTAGTRTKKERIPVSSGNKSRLLFFAGCILLTVLTGLLIPTAVVSTSPMEFVDSNAYSNPFQYVVYAFLISAGTFLVWFTVYYLLAAGKTRVWYSRVIAVVAVAAVVNYMFFGTNYGNMTSLMRYDIDVADSITPSMIILNSGVLLAVAIVVWLLMKKKAAIVRTFCILASLVLFGMSAANAISINGQLSKIEKLTGQQAEDLNDVIHLDRNGKNVIVLMLDRAAGRYAPFLFQEKPELQEQFSGFVCYPNTISYGGYTIVASASLFGGYEYLPQKLNEQRRDVPLYEKQNEALRVMPVSFLNQGYEVTVCDPPYGNHHWIPDISIYDDYPEVRAFITRDRYGNGGEEVREASEQIRKRNLFCYSIFRIAPTIIQSELYDKSNYNHADGEFIVNGYSLFMGSYSVLTHLPQITQIQETGQGRFLMMANNTTHDPIIIHEPDYEPQPGHVNNSEYDAQHPIRESMDGSTISLENELQLECYQTNMAALLQVGKWLDYLKEQGVYDNTRIIIVSDHGKGLACEDMIIPDGGGEITLYNPLLLVKDFDSRQDFSISRDFMTNADTSLMAMKDIIEPAVNPFTKEVMTDTDKENNEQYISTWTTFTDKMDEYTFLDVRYLEMKNHEVLNPANWRLAE